jgi:hypothetical protein
VHRARALLTLVCAVAFGCVDDAPSASVPTGSLQGPVVAEVDGDVIGLAEVQHLCSVTGLSPRAALARLVSERLLVRHAAEQGYGELRAVERAAARARVRALLASTIEASGEASTPDQQRVRLEQLLTELAQKSKVSYDEVAIRQAFAHESR